LKKLIKHPFFGTLAAYGSATLFSAVVNMITGVLMIGFLTPAELGLWQSLSILQLYVPFLELGVNNGLNREIPYLHGQGKEEEARGYASAALTYSVMLSVFFAVIGVITFCISHFVLAKPLTLSLGLLTVFAIVSVNAYNRYLTVTFRSSSGFVQLSKRMYINQALTILLFPLVYFFKYYGLLAYTLLTLVNITVLMHLIRPFRIPFRFDVRRLLELGKVGLPVYILNYLRSLISTFPRLILISSGGTVLVGLYTPATALAAAISVFPNVFANVLFPRLSYRYGKTGRPADLWPAVWKIYLILFLVGIPQVIAAYFLAPWVIQKYFPLYTSAITAMQVMSLAILVAGSGVSYNIYNILKAYRWSSAFTFVELGLSLLMPYLAVKFLSGNLLTIVASAFVGTQVVLAFFNLLLLRRVLFSDRFIIAQDPVPVSQNPTEYAQT